MRPEVLNRGYGPATKLLFGLIRLVSRHPVPDAAKLVFYRPDFYGTRAKEFTHEAMRGPSAWSVADRELMAAYVSKVNESAFCIGAHTATARQAYQDEPKVAAVLADLESAPVEDGLRATLRMLGQPSGDRLALGVGDAQMLVGMHAAIHRAVSFIYRHKTRVQMVGTLSRHWQWT